MMLKQRLHDESGVALVMALLGVVILSGLAVVFVGRATTETRAAAFSQNHESAIHVAEAATDRLIATIAADPDHVTTDADGVEIILPSSLVDEDAESQWAMDLHRTGRISNTDLTSVSEGWLGRSSEGQAYAFRPRSDVFDVEEDEFPPADVIYAVSAVPSFDHPRAAFRVLKLQVAQAAYSPEFAFLTDGAFTFGGNAAIISPGCDPAAPDPDQCYANVHTNQGYSQSGSSSIIEGSISTSTANCPAGSTALLGCTADADVQDIPEITARANYAPDGDKLFPDPAGQEVKWYDLCPNGDVIESSANTPPCVLDAAQAPVWTSTGGNTRFRGWRFQASQNEWQASSIEAGVFYVYQADASINGSEGNEQRSATVIVETDPANPSRSGSLSVAGNPQMQAATEGLLLLAEADLDLSGTATAGDCGENPPGYSGLMYAGEQFDSQGTVELRGAVIVADVSDDHNLVKRNNASVGGTMCLEFDPDLTFDLRGQWVVTFWNELRPR
jgi:hypothetical protein